VVYSTSSLKTGHDQHHEIGIPDHEEFPMNCVALVTTVCRGFARDGEGLVGGGRELEAKTVLAKR
jgi:hypothetical protein